jgi:hypothetical protein
VSAGPSEPGRAPGPKVFITYRRQETAIHAGRLYDAMVVRFGEGNVFMDVDMAPGVDFVERITEAVAACHVLIVVMGPTWATVKNDEGEARLADPEDFVRLEVETALRRRDVTPIPVLVGGAQMPNREDLPEEVRALTRRNALELSNLRWRQDVGRLISTLDELLAESRPVPGAPFAERGAASEKAAPADAAQPGETAPPSTVSTATPLEAKTAAPSTRLGRRTRWALLGTLAIAAIVVAIVVAAGGGGSSSPPTEAGGGGSPSPPTQFRPADLPGLVLPETPEPASNLGFTKDSPRSASRSGPGALKSLADWNVPVENLPSALEGLKAANNRYWGPLDRSEQPQRAFSRALVFKNEAAATTAFAKLATGLKTEPVMPAVPGQEDFDWGVYGDSLGVLHNASTAPEYQYLWRTGNLLQDFELDSTSPDTPVTEDIATGSAVQMRCLPATGLCPQ